MKKHFRFPAALMLSMLFSAAAQANSIPAHLDFDKFNTPRECSPAEKHAGKTNCHICDADTPNVVLPYNAQNARIPDAVIIPKPDNSGYSRDQYRNAWNQSTTTSGKPFDLRQALLAKQRQSRGSSIVSGGSDASVVLHGYNLTGYAGSPDYAKDPTSMYPLSMRAKCDTFRPRYSAEEAVRRGDKSGFRGAAIIGFAGGTISPDFFRRITNPAGGKGQNLAIGSGNAGATGDFFMATKSFACVEYQTKRDGQIDNGAGQTKGGKHIRLNKERGNDCEEPLRKFYDTKVDEIYCYAKACDGEENGYFTPGTKMVRYLYLMTNPYFFYGMTPFESWKAAMQRPDNPNTAP